MSIKQNLILSDCLRKRRMFSVKLNEVPKKVPISSRKRKIRIKFDANFRGKFLSGSILTLGDRFLRLASMQIFGVRFLRSASNADFRGPISTLRVGVNFRRTFATLSLGPYFKRSTSALISRRRFQR